MKRFAAWWDGFSWSVLEDWWPVIVPALLFVAIIVIVVVIH